MKKSIVFFVLVSLSSCKSESPVAPHFQQPPLYIGPSVRVLSTDTLAGMMGTMSIVEDNPVLGLSNLGSGFYTSAIFFDSFWKMVQAGNVELNGITIPQHGGDYSTGSTLSFGVPHYWQITANSSGTVPNIDDSVQSPNLFHITYPSSIRDTVSPEAGFTCTWGNPGTDSVTIIIYYDSVGTHVFYDTSVHNSVIPPTYKTVANTGSYFVGSSMLSSLPGSGAAQLWVVAYRKKVVSASRRSYLLYSTSRARSWFAIKNNP